MTIEDKNFLMRQFKMIAKGLGQVVSDDNTGNLEIFLNDPESGELDAKVVLKQLITEGKLTNAKNYWAEVKDTLPIHEQQMIDSWLAQQLPE